MDSIELKLANLRSELLGDRTSTGNNHTHNDHPPNDHTPDSPEGSQEDEEDTQKLDQFLKQQNYSISNKEEETNLDKTHLQRVSSLNNDAFDDSDGGVVSRSLTFFTVKCSESPEMGVVDEGVELVEVDDAIFKGIVPLKCTLSLGKMETLDKLAKVSEPYINAVVKLISSALGNLIIIM